MSAIGLNLRRWRIAVATHDVENPTHTSYGIGLSHFDIERLGLEEGEELWSGITLYCDAKGTGNFRVLCDGDHDNARETSAQEAKPVHAVAAEPVAA